MKKLLIVFALLPFAYAQEVEPVTEITPQEDVHLAVQESSSRPLPPPPTEVKATDLMTTGSIQMPEQLLSSEEEADKEKVEEKVMEEKSKEEQAPAQKSPVKRAKKALNEMSIDEKFERLEHKINKLRIRSHSDRALINNLQKQIIKLKEKIKKI